MNMKRKLPKRLDGQVKACPFCGKKAGYYRKYYKGSLSLMRPQETEGVPMGCMVWLGCFNSYCKIQPRIHWTVNDDDGERRSVEDWNNRL